jgi:hypothetical protein
MFCFENVPNESSTKNYRSGTGILWQVRPNQRALADQLLYPLWSTARFKLLIWHILKVFNLWGCEVNEGEYNGKDNYVILILSENTHILHILRA